MYIPRSRLRPTDPSYESELQISFNSGSNTTVYIHIGYYRPGASSWEIVNG
jgi:hypothetical protein